MNYQYDGSFEGFLSVIFQIYHDGAGQAEDIEEVRMGEGLFGNYCFVPSDWGAAERVLKGFMDRAGSRASAILYHAFLSDEAKKERLLFRYMRYGFQRKTNSSGFMRESWMWTVAGWARKTERERHRMLGLIRFSELEDGTLYAPIRPDTCIIPLTAGHFKKRMPVQKWMIHDVGHHIAVYYDGKTAELVHIQESAANPPLGGDEQTVRRWWTAYYKSTAIKERLNPQLRRSFMPEKYWSFLTEMQDVNDPEK